MGQQRAVELISVVPSVPVSEECLSSCPPSSEPISLGNTASLGLSLCSSEADSGLGDAVYGFIAAVSFSSSEVFAVRPSRF